jgi:TfoX/Sxy family transcriptional regulator of competence genes
MPFDEGLAARLEEVVLRDFQHVGGLVETRIFGGFGYLLHGNMCVGIHKDTLIIRAGPEVAAALLEEDGVGPMDFTGKVMKGWATVWPDALADDADLARFCQHAIDFVSGLPKKR